MRRRPLGWRALSATAVAAALWAGLALLPGLKGFSSHYWGPEQPWTHRDWLGSWWLHWASSRGGTELWLERQARPEGALPLVHHIPNPWDGWALGQLVFALTPPLGWNLLQLTLHLANAAAAGLLCRSAGARALPSLAACALLASSPVMLHEVVGGRTLSGVVSPGLCALALLLRGGRGREALAGLLIGLQGLLWLYHGLVVGVLALILRPCLGLGWALLPMLPYALWLQPALDQAPRGAPPAGYTSLPLAGLLGLAEVPEKLRLHPLLLLGLWPGRGRRGRLALAGALGLGLALGPTPGWTREQPWLVSPLAWVMALVPGVDRWHHPLRAALVALPLAAASLAPRLRSRCSAALVVLLSLCTLPDLWVAAPASGPLQPPGAGLACWLRGEEPAGVVDVTGRDGAALGLQALHRAPILEGLRVLRPGPEANPGSGPALRARVDGWLRGERQPGLAVELQRAGFSHVLAVDRGQALPLETLEADLGPPLRPGLWSLHGLPSHAVHSPRGDPVSQPDPP